MELEVEGVIFEWRGPAPFLFVRVPDAEAEAISTVAASVSYGWGVIPVRGRLGDTEFTTSLFPKDGGYLVPIKLAVQRAEDVGAGDEVRITLTLDV